MIWLLLLSLFTLAHGQFVQLGSDIDGSNADDRAGDAVAMSQDGSRVAISSGRAEVGGLTKAGTVRVYDYSTNSWQQLGLDINGDAASEEQGFSLDLNSDGTILAVGSIGTDSYDGRVRVWQYTTSWNQLGSTINTFGSLTGLSVSLSSDGHTLAIGSSAGKASVFEYTNNAWAAKGGTLDVTSMSTSGVWVALNGDGSVLAISQDSYSTSRGYVRIYEWGTDWTQIGQDIVGEQDVGKCGESMGLSNDGHTVVFGCIGVDPKGVVRVYEYDTTWTQIGSDILGIADDDYFGKSVTISGDGSIVAGGSSINSGYTRVYINYNNNWEQISDDIHGVAAGDSSGGGSNGGRTISLSGDGKRIAIGAPYHDNKGHVRIYEIPSMVCETDERVQDSACLACAPGKTNEAGDFIFVNSGCDDVICLVDQRVQNYKCENCPAGTWRVAGDDASQGDTTCTESLCEENHRVKDNICVPCEDGFIRLAGDKTDGADTECFDASTCGGVTCDPIGTEACVNHKCVCNNLFGGQDCSLDRSPSARREKLLMARKKALPTRANLKQRQKELKDLAKEILEEEIAKGLSTKQAVKNARIEVELQDVQQEVQVVVAKMAKIPVLAVGPENKDETDTCDQGPECASLDIAEEGDEITFLDTADDSGSWTALTNGNDIVSKQTRVSETVYDMQCWNNTWGVKTTVDVTTEGKLYECNGHIILVGSQASICTPTTCQNGGTCTVDGLSFKCTCPEGFIGEFCETSADITHCHQMDCSDFGGHKAGECTDCTVANCCNYASRSLFDAHCDTLSATQDYVNAKCCHRTYCL